MNPKAWVEAVLELIWRVGLRVVLWIAFGYFLFRVRSVIAAIIIAAVLTYAVLPIVDFICGYRIRGMSRRFQRVTVTLVVFVVLASMTVTLSAAFVSPFQAELESLAGRFELYGTHLRGMAVNAQKWYVTLPPDVQRFIQTQDLQSVVERVTTWTQQAVGTTINLLSHLVSIILIPVLAFYFALDSRTLKREFVALVPRGRTREALAILHEINGIMRSYVIGQIILCVIAGVFVGIALKAFDMQYVLILSVFAGISRAIPIVGPIVSGIAIVVLALANSPFAAIYLLAFFVLLHFVESKFIMPKLIGDRMQLHPAIIIVVLLIGAEFFGILGMFMAAPVAAIARVLVRHYLIRPKHLRVWGMPYRTSEPILADGEAEPVTSPGGAAKQ